MSVTTDAAARMCRSKQFRPCATAGLVLVFLVTFLLILLPTLV